MATNTAANGSDGTGDPAPSQTLYVNNLVESGVDVDTLKAELRELFQEFGDILEVCAWPKRTGRLPNGHYRKGQAWICFGTVDAASAAMTKLQGHVFHEKPMRVAYAKNKSHVLSKRDGSFVPRETLKFSGAMAEATALAADQNAAGMDVDSPAARPAAQAQATAVDRMPVTGVPVPNPNAQNLPHHILFLEQLPLDCEHGVLDALFRQHAGMVEVRLIKARRVAFVEFSDVAQAAQAKHNLDGHELSPGSRIMVNFSKQ